MFKWFVDTWREDKSYFIGYYGGLGTGIMLWMIDKYGWSLL